MTNLLEETRKLNEQRLDAERQRQEWRQTDHEMRLEQHRRQHEMRMEKAAQTSRHAMELQELRNQVAVKERREKAGAGSDRRRQIASLQVQAMQVLDQAKCSYVIRGDDGKIAGVGREDDEKALELAEDLFAEIERLRNER
jgi:hypothetical protein